MAFWNGKPNASEAARPERQASKRLAADLLRFEKAFEKLERTRNAPGARADEAAEGPPIATRDVHDYLNCLDEAIKQLAEEFAEDAAIANLAKQREVNEASAPIATPIAAAMSNKGSGTTTVSSPIASPITSPLRRPNYNALDTRHGDATSTSTAISQVDTSAV